MPDTWGSASAQTSDIRHAGSDMLYDSCRTVDRYHKSDSVRQRQATKIENIRKHIGCFHAGKLQRASASDSERLLKSRQ